MPCAQREALRSVGCSVHRNEAFPEKRPSFKKEARLCPERREDRRAKLSEKGKPLAGNCWEKAIALAEASVKSREWGATYRAAGDAYRKFARYDEAVAYYEKTLAVKPPEKKNLILEHNQDHARVSIENIRLFETFDLQKIKDGIYWASVPAYNGELVVSATVAGHIIDKIKVVKHAEKQFYTSITDMPTKIIRAQDFRNVDATTGATVTADAIKNAVARALGQGAERP